MSTTLAVAARVSATVVANPTGVTYWPMLVLSTGLSAVSGALSVATGVSATIVAKQYTGVIYWPMLILTTST